jgi:F-type H+-transporting ATPase subunit epsilon
MTDRGFRLTVLTEEKAVIEETVQSIVAPGTEGYLGVLRNHAALITELQAGKLSVTGLDRDTPETYAVSGGFLEVSHNNATLLADSLEPVVEIDVSRAEKAAERARKRLHERGPNVDAARAEAALERALNRMRLARRHIPA